MKIKKIISIVMVSLLTVACLSGCGSSSKVATQYIETGMMADGVSMNFTGASAPSQNYSKVMNTADSVMEYKTESVTTSSGSGSSSTNNSKVNDTIPKTNKMDLLKSFAFITIQSTFCLFTYI